MPGFNVLVKFPHGEETVFADVDAPSCKTVYTGWDGRKWKVTRFKTRKSHVDGHDTDFEAVVEDITPDEAAQTLYTNVCTLEGVPMLAGLSLPRAAYQVLLNPRQPRIRKLAEEADEPARSTLLRALEREQAVVALTIPEREQLLHAVTDGEFTEQPLRDRGRAASGAHLAQARGTHQITPAQLASGDRTFGAVQCPGAVSSVTGLRQWGRQGEGGPAPVATAASPTAPRTGECRSRYTAVCAATALARPGVHRRRLPEAHRFHRHAGWQRLRIGVCGLRRLPIDYRRSTSPALLRPIVVRQAHLQREALPAAEGLVTVDDELFRTLLERVRDLNRQADTLTRSHARLNEHIRARLTWQRNAPSVPADQRKLADEVIEVLETPKLSSTQSRRLQQIFFGR